MDTAIGLLELLDGHQTFRLVAEVDDYVFVGNLKNMTLKQFAFMRRSKMAIVVQELLVIGLFSRHGWSYVLLVCAVGHRQDSRFMLLQTVHFGCSCSYSG